MNNNNENLYQPPIYPPIYPVKPKREIIPSTGRDIVFAILFIFASVMAIDFSVFGSFNLGFTISYISFFILSLIYMQKTKLKFSAFTVFSGLSALAGSVVFTIYCDGVSKFFVFCAIAFLSALTLLGLCSKQKYSNGSYLIIFDIIKIIFVMPLENIGNTFMSLFSFGKQDSAKRRRFAGAVLGAVCAIPVLFIVLPLLVSSDAAFEAVLNKTIFGNIDRLMVSVVMGILLSILLYSLMFSLNKDIKRDGINAFGNRGVNRIDSVAVNSFLGVISFVYVVYLLSQLAYFFSGFTGILPEDYSFAEYARRGFFEMGIICAINLFMIFVSIVLSKRKNGNTPLSTRLIALFICLFSLFLVASVASKMYMYINSYGMTRLRILTSVFIAVMAVMLIFVLIRLFVLRFPYMRLAIIFITVIGLVTAYMDIDTTIARYNTEMYKGGYVESIDVQTLAQLSDAAVPYLLELIEDDDSEVAKDAKKELNLRIRRYYNISENDKDLVHNEIEPNDFRSYNYTRKKAKTLLFENRTKFVEMSEEYSF